ncbi:hypothetical protein KCH_70080 [Kitasatospora cheerisanensis KCTC 2395]|uniref:Uncharacterized protein n=2 Tax=Kitasatospora cheerisanensis TaxID=81942 RepID=A0A066YJ94_9ACTN|nr:hypothetical protein KCH_70080 [Kitasatospora cheerisanensis KCTC 2395]
MAPDRQQQLASMREELDALGDARGRADLDGAMSGFLGSEWADHQDPVTALAEQLTDDLTSALAELGTAPAQLAGVVATFTLQDDASARLRPFADGSGLVMVSDAVLTAADVYAAAAAGSLARLAEGGVLRRLWRAAGAHRRGAFARDPQVLTGLLRYYHVHQRVYGLSGKLGVRVGGDGGQIRTLLNVQAARFVFGHELAHHVLGHGRAVSGFSPDERLPVCSAAQQQELDADLLAHRASVRALERDLASVPQLAELAGLIAVLGSLTAMLALHSTERALFVRCGNTHPPAGDRAARLLARLSDRHQQFAAMLLGSLLPVTEQACAYRPDATPFDPALPGRVRELETPHPAAYLAKIGALDTLLCRPTGWLVQVLADADPEGAPQLGTGARQAADGEAEQALLTWGLAPALAARTADPGQALTFHTLYSRLRTAMTAAGMPTEQRLALPLAAARLVEDTLRATG